MESSKYSSLCLALALALSLSLSLSLSLAAMNSPHIMFRQQANPPRVCLLLQDLVQSCARVGRRIVEDMCYETRRAPSPPLPPRAHARALSLSLSFRYRFLFTVSLNHEETPPPPRTRSLSLSHSRCMLACTRALRDQLFSLPGSSR